MHLITLSILLAPLLIAGFLSFPSFTGLSRGKALLALLASIIAGGAYVYTRIVKPRQFIGGSSADAVAAAVAGGVCIVFLTAMVLRLWGRWVGGKATADEQQTGLAGVRAWFSTSNVVVGVAIVLLAWFGYDFQPLLAAIVVGGLLAAYPLLRMESPAVPPGPVPDDLAIGREKIISMLEAGKLTPDESAELLQALGETSLTPARQVPLTSGQRLLLIGAALVALGFFLPWFVINPGKEAGQMLKQMQTSMNSPFVGRNLPDAQINTPTVTISGGDIQRGLGWATLAMALAVAFIPYIATSLDAATARTIRLLCLGIGGIIVLYLLTQNIRFVGIGLVIAVSGYALEIAGILRERGATSV
jgi:hypothetical protein